MYLRGERILENKRETGHGSRSPSSVASAVADRAENRNLGLQGSSQLMPVQAVRSVSLRSRAAERNEKWLHQGNRKTEIPNTTTAKLNTESGRSALCQCLVVGIAMWSRVRGLGFVLAKLKAKRSQDMRLRGRNQPTVRRPGPRTVGQDVRFCWLR